MAAVVVEGDMRVDGDPFGATVGGRDGRALRVREVGEAAGTYSSVGGGFARAGGLNAVRISRITISLRQAKLDEAGPAASATPPKQPLTVHCDMGSCCLTKGRP